MARREIDQTDRRRLDLRTDIGQIDPSNSRDDNRLSIGNHQARPLERVMTGRTPLRSWFVVSLSVVVALQSATPAWAWGRLGHRVISRLAEKCLTPAAKAAIVELLEPGESLADASLWADDNRGQLPKTAPWHYVDVPLDEK
jgi:S1/P1 Nuclease